MSNLNETEFEDLVRKHYQFLVDDFNLVAKKMGDWSFNFESNEIRVSILSEYAVTLSVALQPIGESADNLIKQRVSTNRVEAIVISMCLDPELRYKVVRIDRDPIGCNIPIELERQAKLLKQYCTELLNGDFSRWVEIRKRMLERRSDVMSI
jgi:hypothetical protein